MEKCKGKFSEYDLKFRDNGFLGELAGRVMTDKSRFAMSNDMFAECNIGGTTPFSLFSNSCEVKFTMMYSDYHRHELRLASHRPTSLACPTCNNAAWRLGKHERSRVVKRVQQIKENTFFAGVGSYNNEITPTIISSLPRWAWKDLLLGNLPLLQSYGDMQACEMIIEKVRNADNDDDYDVDSEDEESDDRRQDDGKSLSRMQTVSKKPSFEPSDINNNPSSEGEDYKMDISPGIDNPRTAQNETAESFICCQSSHSKGDDQALSSDQLLLDDLIMTKEMYGKILSEYDAVFEGITVASDNELLFHHDINNNPVPPNVLSPPISHETYNENNVNPIDNLFSEIFATNDGGKDCGDTEMIVDSSDNINRLGQQAIQH